MLHGKICRFQEGIPQGPWETFLSVALEMKLDVRSYVSWCLRGQVGKYLAISVNLYQRHGRKGHRWLESSHGTRLHTVVMAACQVDGGPGCLFGTCNGASVALIHQNVWPMLATSWNLWEGKLKNNIRRA